MSDNLPRSWRYYTTLCPVCKAGKLRQGLGFKEITCSVCEKTLVCPNCQGSRNLELNEGVAICNACTTKWSWPESEKEKDQPRLKCPKCTSCNVIFAHEKGTCLSCQLEFPRRLASLHDSDKSGLITDMQAINNMAAELLSRCPSCNWGGVESPDENTLRCKSCGMTWPKTKEPTLVSALPWEEKCPMCDETGYMARHSSGQLECFSCGSRWTPNETLKLESDPIQLGTLSKKLPYYDDAPKCTHCKIPTDVGLTGDRRWVCNSCHRVLGKKKESSVCPICHEGFFERSGCAVCGAKLRLCRSCSGFFVGMAEGTCEKCKEGAVHECSSCGHEVLLAEADVRCRCSVCEEWSSVVIPEPEFTSDPRLEKMDEYLRFLERKEQLQSLVDDAIANVNDVRYMLTDGRCSEEEFNRLEDCLQNLAEAQAYVDRGFGDEEDGEELWNDHEEEDRWTTFDREWEVRRRQRRLDSYSEVEIEDAGSDLLEGPGCDDTFESISFESLDDVVEVADLGYSHLQEMNRVCGICGGDIDDYGICTGCDKLHDLLP